MKYFLLIISFLAIFNRCSDEAIKPEVDNSLGEKEIPTQESWNAEIYFTEDGNLRAIVFADHLQKFENKKVTLLEGVKIDFYNEDKEKTSTLTSKKGKVDDNTRDMFAIDSVVAVSQEGTTLLTDELNWKNNTQKITTDKFVTFTTKTERIEGFGFESDQSLENYVIYKIIYLTNLSEDESK